MMKSLLDSHSNIYEDDLVTINTGGYRVKEFDSLESFIEYFNKGPSTFSCKYAFLDKILKHTANSNWVDIEYEYYYELLSLYKTVAKHNMGKYDGAERHVKDVNVCLDLIKIKLTEYLHTIKIDSYNNQIENRFNSELEKISFNQVLFLVFNYTNTIELYLNSLKMNSYEVNYIHGRIGSIENPIIFGYGDEMDEYYSKIESLNLNEFLRNMKSFSYLKTTNYQSLSNFLNKSAYTISIMGHSCGLSDRVLLNSIFCHPNCSKIRIYYYQKSNNKNDYFEKTLEISRHFPITEKNRMRNIIIPFSDSTSLT